MLAASPSLWISLPLPALIVDGEDRIVAINPAAELFLNRSETQLRGMGADTIATAEAELTRKLARARGGRSALSIRELPIKVVGKGTVPCRLDVSAFQAQPDGKQGDLLVILQPDIPALDEGYSPAKSAAKSAIGMAEMLAHEIKNPLAGISGAAQLLSMTISPEDQELTDMIVSETKRITKLLDQVEEFGNLLPPSLRAINLHDVLDRSRKSALLGFASAVPIVEEYDPSLPDAKCDPDQLQQVFLNLLKNAAEALGATNAPQILIRTRYESGLRVRNAQGELNPAPLQVDICDNGPGLPAAIADAIFDPFVSGRENGTGLGLALVSKIVADHSGRVSVKSHPGQTVFTVSLPATAHKSEVT